MKAIYKDQPVVVGYSYDLDDGVDAHVVYNLLYGHGWSYDDDNARRMAHEMKVKLQ